MNTLITGFIALITAALTTAIHFFVGGNQSLWAAVVFCGNNEKNPVDTPSILRIMADMNPHKISEKNNTTGVKNTVQEKNKTFYTNFENESKRMTCNDINLQKWSLDRVFYSWIMST